jgi:hypothetical protein
MIFPQLRLLWNPRKPKDRRSDIPDIGLGHITDAGAISLQGGAEQKPALPIMNSLPPPLSIREDKSFRSVINAAIVQAGDQIKSAVKNGALPRNTAIKWIVASGPYFIICTFEPFSQDELTTRGHKPNPSGDTIIAQMIQNQKDNARQMPILEQVYLIGTEEAARAVHAYLLSGHELYSSTDREVI